jgi:hypothetical protein
MTKIERFFKTTENTENNWNMKGEKAIPFPLTLRNSSKLSDRRRISPGLF